MYKTHSVFELPDPATQIWRYLDFTKLVAILSTNALHFTRADQFTDRFEFTLPVPNTDAAKQQYEEAIHEGLDHREAKSASKLARYEFMKRKRQQIAVNCWHVNPHESAAMWALYDEGGKGVAIRSTVERLTDCFDDDPSRSIFVGLVKYIDFNSDSIPTRNTFYPIIYKRKSYSHEQELRAVKDDDLDSTGVKVSVDLEELIERVFVAPTSPQWLEELVRSVLAKYEVNAQVERSDLGADPIW